MGGRALTPHHWAALRWLTSPVFAEMKAAYDRAFGPGAVYFRLVGGALNAIALHPNAASYVGYRTSYKDRSFILRPGMSVPSVADLRQRRAGFEAWLPTVRRVSVEERAVIPCLRRALQSQLWLHELGPGWAFLNQEWRFHGDDGRGRKSDVLAVHLPTGTLGIVEAKSRPKLLAAAEEQVRQYQRYWLRDQHELAPFFTELLQTMGRLYGNDDAARASVEKIPSKAFFLCPLRGTRVRQSPWGPPHGWTLRCLQRKAHYQSLVRAVPSAVRRMRKQENGYRPETPIHRPSSKAFRGLRDRQSAQRANRTMRGATVDEERGREEHVELVREEATRAVRIHRWFRGATPANRRALHRLDARGGEERVRELVRITGVQLSIAAP